MYLVVQHGARRHNAIGKVMVGFNFFLKQEMLKLQSLLVLMTAETCRDAKTRRTRQKKILNQKNRIRCLLSQIAGPDPRIV